MKAVSITGFSLALLISSLLSGCATTPKPAKEFRITQFQTAAVIASNARNRSDSEYDVSSDISNRISNALQISFPSTSFSRADPDFLLSVSDDVRPDAVIKIDATVKRVPVYMGYGAIVHRDVIIRGDVKVINPKTGEILYSRTLEESAGDSKPVEVRTILDTYHELENRAKYEFSTSLHRLFY